MIDKMTRYSTHIVEVHNAWRHPQKRFVMIGLLWRRKLEAGEIYPGHKDYAHAKMREKLAEGVPEPTWRIATREENARQERESLAQSVNQRLAGPGHEADSERRDRNRVNTAKAREARQRKDRYARDKSAKAEEKQQKEQIA